MKKLCFLFAAVLFLFSCNRPRCPMVKGEDLKVEKPIVLVYDIDCFDEILIGSNQRTISYYMHPSHLYYI